MHSRVLLVEESYEAAGQTRVGTKSLIELTDIPWTTEHLNDSDLTIIDSRQPLKYLQGHIPGAVNLPSSAVFDGKTLELLPLDMLTTVFGNAGISEDRMVLVYDSYDGQNGAMLAWTLEFLGHPKVKLLSSFMEQWAKEGRPILYKPLKSQPRTLRAKPNLSARVTLTDISSDQEFKFVDLRSREEFDGTRKGETSQEPLPGAVSLPWTSLLGKDGQLLRPVHEMKWVAFEARIGREDSIVTYCTFGPRAAIGYIAMQQLGFKQVKVFDGVSRQQPKNPGTVNRDDCVVSTFPCQ